MKLFEKRSLSLFRKYRGHNVSELDKKQRNSINKLYQRFIGVSKRINLSGLKMGGYFPISKKIK